MLFRSKTNAAAEFADDGGRAVVRSARDERDAFSATDLAAIFGVDWFVKGHGKVNSGKKYATYWRPSYYWMPLLGLLTGARLNELAQLHLGDIRESEASPGNWVIDFNCEGADKVEVDPADKAEGDDDDTGRKKFKTVHSIRVLPMHPELVQIGRAHV